MLQLNQIAILLILAIGAPLTRAYAGDLPEKIKSRDLRESATGDLTLLGPTFGFAVNSDYGVYDYGIRLGLYDSPDFQWGVSLRQGVPTKSGHGGPSDVSSGGFTSNLTLDGQLYFGNSFFGRAGIELRQYRTIVRGRVYHPGENSAEEDYYSYDRRGVSSFRDMGLTLSVGNNWILERSHLVIGADWIGVYLPLIGLGGHHSADKTEYDHLVHDDDKSIRSSPVVYLSRLNFGYTF